MAGVRRRLRDVGATITGVLGEVLGGRPDAGPDDDPDAGTGSSTGSSTVGEVQEQPGEQGAAGGDVPETGDVPVATETPHAPAAQQDTAPDTAVLDAEPDAACAAAVDLARAAAVQEGGRRVGEHLGARAEDGPLVVSHAFACLDPAYVGWSWAVTVVRAEGSDAVTVDEVVLLPGPDALLAPPWVPYAERVQPGDLGDGDLLPPAPDDPRLVPAVADPDGLTDDLVWELGLGRPRVLSQEGRADAAERWLEGDTGPRSARAKAAPGRCGGCGFLVPLGGALRSAFGACANALAPDDGRVVALDHGCGAHSEQPVELAHAPAAARVQEEPEYDVEHREPRNGSDGADAGDAAAPVDPLPGPAEEEQAEELGHS